LSTRNTSGFTGIVHGYKGWRAFVTYDRKRHHLGTFETAQQAAWFRRNWKLGAPKHRPVKRRNNKSGFRGVNFRRGYWEARLFVKGKFYGLGSHKLRRDAVQARVAAEEALRRGWIIRPTSCHCRGTHAWFEQIDGKEIGRGCICHHTRAKDGTVGHDWSMKPSEKL
jgi:hypothetical protein